MKARSPKISETDEHRTIASYFRKVGLGGGALAIHIRNERGSAWERMIAAQMGVMSGIPDWMILSFEDAGFIELKPRGWKVTKTRTGNYNAHEQRQLETHAKIRFLGHWVEIAETLDEVKDILVRRGIPLRPESISTERIRRGMQKGLEDAAE